MAIPNLKPHRPVIGFSRKKLAERRWFSIREAAEYLSLPGKTIYSLIARGRLPARSVLRIGRQLRINLGVLEDGLLRKSGRGIS